MIEQYQNSEDLFCITPLHSQELFLQRLTNFYGIEDTESSSSHFLVDEAATGEAISNQDARGLQQLLRLDDENDPIIDSILHATPLGQVEIGRRLENGSLHLTSQILVRDEASGQVFSFGRENDQLRIEQFSAAMLLGKFR